MNEQEFMKQTAHIFCQDPKLRSSQQIKQRMEQYDEILCKTLGKVYPPQQFKFTQHQQLNELPQQNTLVDSFIKNLLMADKGALFVYNQQQDNRYYQQPIQTIQPNQQNYESPRPINYPQIINQDSNQEYVFEIIEDSKKRRRLQQQRFQSK